MNEVVRMSRLQEIIQKHEENQQRLTERLTQQLEGRAVLRIKGLAPRDYVAVFCDHEELNNYFAYLGEADSETLLVPVTFDSIVTIGVTAPGIKLFSLVTDVNQPIKEVVIIRTKDMNSITALNYSEE